MLRALLLPAILTGLFCAGFAALLDVVTNALTMWMVIGLAFVSGFLGNVFSQLVLGKGK